MKHKAFPVSNFKALDQAQGVFEAIVAVFGNVDRGGDKILPGAFADSLKAWEVKGRPIPVIFSHEWDNLDAHIGQVLEAKETEQGLYVKAQLEMDEPFAARVWKKMANGTLAEFSFAYEELDSALVKQDGEYINELRKLEVLEVGPTLVGMNPATQLLCVKKAIAPHSTATSDASWDGPANEGRVPSGKTAAFYGKVYAWSDPKGDAAVKTTYRFIHHEVDGDGNPGAANIRACQSAIGVLNGGRGVDVSGQPWAKDREGIHAHLARHLMDGEMDVPELMPMEEMGKAFKASDFATVLRQETTERQLGEERWQVDMAFWEWFAGVVADGTMDKAGRLTVLQTGCNQFMAALMEWAGRAIDASWGQDLAKAGADLMTKVVGERTVKLGDVSQTDRWTMDATAFKAIMGKEAGASALTAMTKEGRRNSNADLDRIQKLHDLTSELGAKCAVGEGPPEGEGGKTVKPSGKAGPSAYATRVALELMELGSE